MNFLDNIIKMLNPDIDIPQVEVVEAPKKFFANIDKATYKILAVSPTCSYETGIKGIEIDTELAIKFLSGEENLSGWEIQLKGEEMRLAKVLKNEHAVYNRVDVISIVELKASEPKSKKIKLHDEDILIVVKDDLAHIYYDGDKISELNQPVRIYFTGEGDPSYLKCAFALDVNILNKITKANKLKNWPNPVIIPIGESEDLSVFTLKSNLKMTLNYL